VRIYSGDEIKGDEFNRVYIKYCEKKNIYMVLFTHLKKSDIIVASRIILK
jgi:hypothetical protein